MPDYISKLPPDLQEFVATSVASGRYESAGQLVQAALDALHREERTAAKKSCVSPIAQSAIAEEDAFRKLWEACHQDTFSLSR